ncbi:hypothetical protein DFH28DRAFT_909360, partial [Melampsora americana]
LYCQADEELRRISHKVQQMLSWSLALDAKIQTVLTLSKSATVLPINLVTGTSSARMKKTAWNDCLSVLESLYHGLLLDHSRLIFRWDSHVLSLLHHTRRYCEVTIAEDNALESNWTDMLHRIIV